MRPFARLFKAGVPVALCTEDPAVSHQSDSPLTIECGLARSLLGLSQADLAELARNSVEFSSFTDLHRRKKAADGAGDGAASDTASSAKLPVPIRDRYRIHRREAESELLSRLASRRVSSGKRGAEAFAESPPGS